ncbi:hypothetical protein [Streptomyces sp. 2112.3]|uniref:hypothetical protein n=1 Tax=Streptomyces sp. 2112.3 TaxID=1881023 RepID=UPI0011600784|nr:hypothetical protein [Streptomyces sp. 2112.3]
MEHVMSQEETVWHLGYVIIGENNKIHELDFGKEVTESEAERHRESTYSLMELFTESPYAALEKRYSSLKATLAELSNPEQDSSSTYGRMGAIQQGVDDFLSAFRAFDDRTSRQLNKKFGAASPELQLFKRALSHEFDTSFAYRFACKLRNYSQHCGRVPFSGNVRGFLGPDGSKNRIFALTLDPAKLLGEFDAWGAKVRADLQSMTNEFSAEDFIDQAMTSCMVAHVKLVISQKEAVEDAANCILSLGSNSANPKRWPAFFTLKKDQWSATSKGQDISFQYVRLDVATHALQSLSGGAALLASIGYGETAT